MNYKEYLKTTKISFDQYTDIKVDYNIHTVKDGLIVFYKNYLFVYKIFNNIVLVEDYNIPKTPNQILENIK